jgi:hypothetical protein
LGFADTREGAERMGGEHVAADREQAHAVNVELGARRVPGRT